MDTCLVLSGLGPDRPGLAQAISEAAFETGCNILNSKMAVLGGEFAILLLLQGAQAALDELRNKISELQTSTGLTLATKSTTARNRDAFGAAILYRLQVVGMDHPGIVFRVTRFLAEHGINITALDTDACPAPVTGTPMFRMNVLAEVRPETSIRQVKEGLLNLCDDLNMDGGIEAV
jgi:glycine cleavage system transcriptional repressor